MIDDVEISPLSALLNKTLYKRPVQNILRLGLLAIGTLGTVYGGNKVYEYAKTQKAQDAAIDQMRDRIDAKLTQFSNNGFDNAEQAYAVADFKRKTGFSISGDRDFESSSVTKISENGKTEFVLQALIDPAKAKIAVDEAATWAKANGTNSRLPDDLKQLDKVLGDQPRPEAPYRSAIPHGPQYNMPTAHTP